MEYIKQNFESGQILKADNMNYIEDGIVANTEAINTINDALPNKAESSHTHSEYLTEKDLTNADWNQSDETKKDYIKNKPFYEKVISEPNETIVLEEAERELVPSGGDVGDCYYHFTDEEETAIENILEGISVAKLNLCIDGTDYIYDFYRDTDLSWKTDSTPQTALLFGCGIEGDSGWSIMSVPFMSKVSAGVHNISVTYLTEGEVEIVRLDEKYLPDTIATKDYVNKMFNSIVNGDEVSY